MAIAFRMRKEYWDTLGSVIHVDGTVRPQFVEEPDNPAFYRLLKEVQKRTGFGVVANTSFNLHGRTIVSTAGDAIEDYLACNLDALYLEGQRITRKRSRG
jgi:carbamoyltransferase